MLISVASVAPAAVLWKVRARFARVEYGSDMRTAPALLTGLLVALTLVACVPDNEPVRPDPSPTASPIFASDEEALAAAEAAYGAYLAVSDQILAEAGADSDRLLSVATSDLYADAIAGFESFASKEWRSVGTTSFDSAELQNFDPHATPGDPMVVFYVCVDLSGIDVLDSTGTSVVSPNRIDRSPYQVAVTTVDADDAGLIVAGDEPWGGENFCEVE